MEDTLFLFWIKNNRKKRIIKGSHEGFNCFFKKKVKGLLTLFRFELPFAAGVSVLMGEILALGKFPSISEALLGFFSVFFISASALILNDYFDVEIDKVNAPFRPIPSGLVTRREVLLLSIAVTILGLLISLLAGLLVFVVAVPVWLVGFLYNWRFKKAGLIGNLMVCFSVGMTFIFGGLVVGLPFEKMVWYFALIGFLIDLGQEISVDALDAKGDSLAGSRSLAILWGVEPVIKLGSVIFFFVIGLSLIPFFLGWMESIYLTPILLMDLVILFGTIRLLGSKDEKPRRKYARLIYFGGILGMVFFIVFRLFI